MSQGYTNDYSSTLTSSYTAGGGNLIVNSASGLPTSGLAFYLQVDSEYFLVASYTGTTLTVTGAQQGSTAANHASGAIISGCWWLPAVIDGIRSDQSQVGTFASIPVSNMKAGDRYRCTDAPYDLVFDGSNWRYFCGGYGEVIPPPSSSWSWDNQGSSTITSTNGPLVLKAPRTGSTGLSLRYRTAPSTPYTITVLRDADISGMDAPSSSTWTNCGSNIFFRDSSGKIMEFRVGSASNDFEVTSAKWTNSTTFSAAYVDAASSSQTGQWFVSRPRMWLQMSDDGTNLTFRWSIDGQSWTQFDQRARTNYFTSGPTQIGFGAYNNGCGVVMQVISWAIS